MRPNRAGGNLITIGLTGGAASGKSTVSRILKGLGAEIIDVDTIGREMVHRGSPYLDKIVRAFGRDILLDDGTLNRKRLGNIVFGDREKLKLLNGIVHPPMIERVKFLVEDKKRRSAAGKLVIDAAILIEMGLHRIVDQVWLVKISRELQVMRLIERDGISREKAEDMVASQMPAEEKTKFADVIIDNSGTVEELEKKVKELWHRI